MMAISGDYQECSYRFLSGEVHEIILHSASIRALSQCFGELGRIFAHAPLDQPLLILSDIRQSGIPPARPLTQFAYRLLKDHPNHPRAYNAVIHSESGLLHMFMGVMGQLALLYGAKVRFFNSSQRERAIAWLLSKRDVQVAGRR